MIGKFLCGIHLRMNPMSLLLWRLRRMQSLAEEYPHRIGPTYRNSSCSRSRGLGMIFVRPKPCPVGFLFAIVMNMKQRSPNSFSAPCSKQKLAYVVLTNVFGLKGGVVDSRGPRIIMGKSVTERWALSGTVISAGKSLSVRRPSVCE